MIVQPDFPDHWKTRLVVAEVGCETAVCCILRLWGFCQQRKRWVLPDLTPAMLTAICRWGGAPDVFWTAMLGRFIDQTPDGFEVHEWATANVALINSWNNGKRSKGRPPKTHGKPTGSDWANPVETPIGLDRIGSSLREEEEGKPSLPPGGGEGGGNDGEDGQKGPSTDKRRGSGGADEGGGQDGAPSADKRPPLDEIVDLYHELCPTLPKVQKIGDQRRTALRARWADAKKDGEEPLVWFRRLFLTAGQSQKCAGGGWCSFDWLLSPTNSQKVLEGNYNNDRGGTPGQPKKRYYANAQQSSE